MRRWILPISLTIGVVIGSGWTASWWAMRQTRQVPEFYTRATQQMPKQTLEASRQLNAHVVRLKDDAAKIGFWHAEFSDAQINAWLVEEFPKKFPNLLARGATDPRVMIEDGHVIVAARYKNKRFDTVVSCEISAELTEQPNLVAVKVRRLRAGALPLPLSPFLKGITREAASGDVDVNWDYTESGPVALITIPSEHPKYVRSPVIVESLHMTAGKAVLSGHTGPLARQVFEPDGPLYRFVSYRHPDTRNRHDPSASAAEKLSVESRSIRILR